MWCVGNLTPEYRERMYDILDLYAKEYDPEEPVVCVDEKSKQLLGETREPLKGKIRKTDYEYKRNGTRNIFVSVEPKGGRRFARVTRYRKKADFAKFVRHLADKKYPKAKVIHLVLDNLNTHFEKSFTETFDEKEAKRILSRIRFHYTPKHASWLDMAEIEIGIMDRQCLDRRIPTEKELRKEINAWQKERNKMNAKIVWKFTRQDADEKLGKRYVT